MSSQLPGYVFPASVGGGGGGGSSSGQVSGSFGTALQLVDSTFTTAEAISGGRAVSFSQSGIIQIAMAAVSGRMPAIGIVRDNYTSGQLATTYLAGQIFNASSGTPFDFSGWTGQPIYVGASGDVIASGAPAASGNVQQTMGQSIAQSGLMLSVGTALEGVVAQSGDIGSGAIQGAAGGGFRSVASGSLGTYDGSSGMTTWGSVTVSPFNSGLNFGIAPLTTAENISGGRAVCLTQSGLLAIAMASVSGRMPAIGLVLDNVAAGIPVNVYTQGAFQLTSGLLNYSGYLSKPIFVGRSGQLVTSSGSWNSGGLNLSSGGDFVQRVGTAVNSGAFIINIGDSILQTQLIGTTQMLDVANRSFGV